MAKISDTSSYPNITPASGDYLVLTDVSDSNNTKTVTVQALSNFIGGGSGNAQAIVETVRNNSGSTIEKGQPLHITGVSGTTPTVEVADASNAAKMPVSGLANEQILNNTDGEMIVSGILEGIDTANINGSPAEAAVLYVNTATGGSIDFLSTNPPATEANLIQNIGIIVKNSPGTSGSIQVTAIGRTNATPNLNQGSIFIGDSSSQQSTLAIGGSGTVLTSNGTTATWSAPTSGDTYDLNAVQDGLNVDLNLTSGSGTDNSVVQLTAGENITLTRNSASQMTISSPTSDAGYSPFEIYSGETVQSGIFSVFTQAIADAIITGINTAKVYITSTGVGRSIAVSVYSGVLAGGGTGGTLLTSGSVTNVVAGLNTITLTSFDLTAGDNIVIYVSSNGAEPLGKTVTLNEASLSVANTSYLASPDNDLATALDGAEVGEDAIKRVCVHFYAG